MDQEPRKQGRPKTRQGDTNQERNYNSMKKLSAQGYFKEYYNHHQILKQQLNQNNILLITNIMTLKQLKNLIIQQKLN